MSIEFHMDICYDYIIKTKHNKKELTNMTETVKEIKGHKVERHIGTKRQYFVNVREGKGFKEFHTFRTIKSAVEFIEKTF